MSGMLTRAGARRQEVERVRAAFDAIPHDLLVSIFASLLDGPEQTSQENVDRRRWVRETFPLVCRAWRDIYRSQQASPLHRMMEIDFSSEFLGGQEEEDEEVVSRRRFVRVESVVAWARRHARDVQTLRVCGGSWAVWRPRYFTSRDMARLLKILAPSPHLATIDIDEDLSALVEAPFWKSLRRRVAPAGRLRVLRVRDIYVSLSEDNVAFLSQLTNLEYLNLETTRTDVPVGLRAFPASIPALANLRVLDLSYNNGITSLPAAISSLQRLMALVMSSCSLVSLPPELGALPRLSMLSLGENSGLGAAIEDVAFPAALRRLTSLRYLEIGDCGLRAVPRFVSELRGLESLHLGANRELGENAGPPNYGFPSPFPQLPALTELVLYDCALSTVPTAVLSSMPRLQILNLSSNGISSLPGDLGRRLPQLRGIDLSRNSFAAVPFRALVGARNLEMIDLASNAPLQAEEPLDSILDEFPRLRDVWVRKGGGNWTPASRANLERFAAALRERDSTAVVTFLPP